MDAIEFSYVPVFARYWALNWHILKKQVGKLVPFGALSLIVFSASPAILAKHRPQAPYTEHYQMAWPLLILPAILILLVAATYRCARKRWNVSQELRETKEYAISSEGVRVTASTFQGFLEWTHFAKADVTRRFVYLQTHQGLFHYFPVSAVPEPGRLREMLSGKLKV